MKNKFLFDISGFESDFRTKYNHFESSHLLNDFKNLFNNFESVNHFVNSIYNRFNAKLDFNALCRGEKIRDYISLIYNPHRLLVNIKNKNIFSALKDEKFLNTLFIYLDKFKLLNNSLFSIFKLFSLGFYGYSVATDFPSYIARDIYLKYCQKDFKVFDPCAGWGGRLIGACSTLYNLYYECCEINNLTCKGLNNISDFLNEGNKKFNIKINNMKIEDYNNKNYFDFAFTSPPYFDTEIYDCNDVNQACNLYKNYTQFENIFLYKLVLNTMNALKENSIFLLNIGCQKYDMLGSIKKICEKLNYKYKQVNSFIKNRSDINKNNQSEIFIEIQK